MKGRFCLIAVTCFMAVAASAQASTIRFDSVNLGDGAWRYDYEILNDTLAVPVDEFAIYFDLGLYANLRDASGSASWDLLTIQPDPLLPDDGFVDGLAFEGGLAPGVPSFFSVTFDFLGIGAPGSQRFDFIDSGRFVVLDSGFTVARLPQEPPTDAPEPAAPLLLFATALAALGVPRLFKRRFRRIAAR